MTAETFTPDWPWSEDSNDHSSKTERSEVDRTIALAAARCFGTPDGMKVLKYLRDLTIERMCGPHLPDAVLRDLEGQRRLVHQLYALIERGRNGE